MNPINRLIALHWLIMIYDRICACDYLDGLMRLLNSAETTMHPEEFKNNEAIKFYDEEYKRVLGMGLCFVSEQGPDDFGPDETTVPVLFTVSQEREILDLYEQIENKINPEFVEYTKEWRIGCCYIVMDLMKERGIR